MIALAASCISKSGEAYHSGNMPLLHPVSSRSETSLLSNPSIAHPDLLSATKQLDACLSLLSDGYLIKQFQTGSARNSFLLDVHRCIEDESNHCKYDIELLDNHLQLAGSKGLYKRVVLGVKRRTEAKVQLIPKTLAPYEERVAWCRFMTEELVMIVRGCVMLKELILILLMKVC